MKPRVWLLAGFTVMTTGAGAWWQRSAPSPAAPSLHHIHLRVDDPAAAMDSYAQAHGCTKVILQGLGVGVRCGPTYLLFDRTTQVAANPTVRGRIMVQGSGEAAVVSAEVAVVDGVAASAWMLDRLGFAATGALSFVPLAAGSSMPDEVTHVAVGLVDPAPLVKRLAAAGVRTLARGPESTTFLGASGLAVEIVSDAGLGPDAFWCAMHPDVRSPNRGKCPICGMALVPIPPPVFGDDRMDVSYRAGANGRGRLTLRIVDPATGKPVTSFLTVHERPFHLFIVSRDLGYFEHVHPQVMKDGTLVLDVALPKPDLYMLYGDFYPTGGTPQLVQSPLVTPDYRGSPFPSMTTPVVEPVLTKVANGSSVRLDPPKLSAGHDGVLIFNLSAAGSGAPLTDLEPYLGAAGHLFMVSADLVTAEHSHPAEFTTKGPTLTFQVQPPQAGVYKIWLQFQRQGKLQTIAFLISVKR